MHYPHARDTLIHLPERSRDDAVIDNKDVLLEHSGHRNEGSQRNSAISLSTSSHACKRMTAKVSTRRVCQSHGFEGPIA